MIITCEECKTKFNLDESLLKPEGSKVRCSACRCVFTAYPPSDILHEPETAPPLEIGPDRDDGFFSQDTDLEFDADLQDDMELSLDEDDLSLDIGQDLSFDSELDFDSDLDMDAGVPLDITSDDDSSLLETPPEETEIDVSGQDEDLEEIRIEEDTYDFDEIEASLKEEEPEEEELNLELDVDIDIADDKDEETPLSEEDLSVEEIAPEDEEELDLSHYEDFLSASSEDSDVPVDDDAIEEADTPPEEAGIDLDEDTEGSELDTEETPPHAEGERTVIGDEDLEPPLVSDLMADYDKGDKKGSWIVRLFLMFVFLLIIFLAGYAICLMKGIEVPYLTQLEIPYVTDFVKSYIPKPDPVELTPEKKSVNGRFVTNMASGTLFVITGTVTNRSNITCSSVKVQGSLITKNKVKTKTKTVFCGNVIPESTLKTIEISAINDLLAREEGNNGANANIGPGKSVPFMIVFSDLPDNLQNFTVSVVGFEKHDAKK